MYKFISLDAIDKTWPTPTDVERSHQWDYKVHVATALREFMNEFAETRTPAGTVFCFDPMQLTLNQGDNVDSETIDYKQIPEKRVWEIVQLMLQGHTVIAVSSSDFSSMIKHLLWAFTRDHLDRLSGGTILHLLPECGRDHIEVHFRDGRMHIHFPNSIQREIRGQAQGRLYPEAAPVTRALSYNPIIGFEGLDPERDPLPPITQSDKTVTVHVTISQLRHTDSVENLHGQDKGIDSTPPQLTIAHNYRGSDAFMRDDAKFGAVKRWVNSVSESSDGGAAHINNIRHFMWMGSTNHDLAFRHVDKGLFPNLAGNIGFQIDHAKQETQEAPDYHIKSSDMAAIFTCPDYKRTLPFILLSCLRHTTYPQY